MKAILGAFLLVVCVSALKIEDGDVDWYSKAGTTKHYAVMKKALDHYGAGKKCTEMNARLALPANEEENRFLTMLANKKGGEHFWIGAWAKMVDGDREFWTYEKKLDYTNWLSGEPNNYMSIFGNEDCVSANFKKLGGWNDLRCNNKLWFICEKTKVSSVDGKMFEFKYFDIYGRGETARLLFALAGVEYKDTRVKAEEWTAMKYKTVWGFLPEMTISYEKDGEKKEWTMAQSNAINRYLAQLFGLYGKDGYGNWIDMLVECLTDVMGPLFTLMTTQQTDPARFAAVYNSTRDSLPWWYGRMQHFMEKKSGGEWFVGEEPTLADTMAYHVFWMVEQYYPGTLDDPAHAKLKAHSLRFASLPNIAKWLKERPVRPIK